MPLQPCQAEGDLSRGVPESAFPRQACPIVEPDVILAHDTTDYPCFNSMLLVPMYLPMDVVQLSQLRPPPVFLSVKGLVNQSRVLVTLLLGQWSLAAEGQKRVSIVRKDNREREEERGDLSHWGANEKESYSFLYSFNMHLNVQNVQGTARDTTVNKTEPALGEDSFSWETGNYKAVKM